MLDSGNRISLSCADELRAALPGRGVLPGDELYDEGCRVWNGAVHHRPKLIAFCKRPKDVQAFGTPLSAEIGLATYADMLAQFDAWVEAVDGSHWDFRTRSLPALTADAADAMIAAEARAAPPLCSIFRHHFHGAATRIAADSAAFGLHREHFMVEIVAGWKPDGDDGAAHRRWAHDLWQSLAPFALPGGYANLLGPDNREQAAGAYGGNAARLRVLKRRFDPDGVFTSAIPLPLLEV
jgi:FAD/FMN-containing dehydrogenase